MVVILSIVVLSISISISISVPDLEDRTSLHVGAGCNFIFLLVEGLQDTFDLRVDALDITYFFLIHLVQLPY